MAISTGSFPKATQPGGKLGTMFGKAKKGPKTTAKKKAKGC